ncbi:alpha/beta hydrolase [Echinicola soli]|uniref:Alpha/beta hydrolase n=1 Tax=Echinicola soli TaxID=2591634 RepID=A0A514CKF9_9BACT|nr:alpha/beta hydrolase [Echinicola soli]QDH80144.1 alpha/beta hydrolase [Echinicola soli]
MEILLPFSPAAMCKESDFGYMRLFRSIGFLILLFMVMGKSPVKAQSKAEGDWKGVLEVMGQKLPLVFHLNKTDEKWEGTMDSPKQGATGISLNEVSVDSSNVSLGISRLNISYNGKVEQDTIRGTFSQGGMEFPLVLARLPEGDQGMGKRPQEPKGPFDYEEIETSFTNVAAGITLKGTITKPKGMGPFPAVILVSGSGPQDRNEEMFGHKPFLVLADYFTQNGIAVLRYDERGVGGSEGDFDGASTFDFADDAEAAMTHLRKFPFVNQLKVGVIGHSEGGMIAWMMAAKHNGLCFAVTIAGLTVPVPQLMKQQVRDLLASVEAPEEQKKREEEVIGIFYEVLAQTNDYDSLEIVLPARLEEYLVGAGEHYTEDELEDFVSKYANILNPWFFAFAKINPQEYIRKTEIPVLALFGDKDIQVNGSINYEVLEVMKEENGKGNFTIKLYPDLNHLFQHSSTGSMAEYGAIEETFSDEVMEDIAQWVLSQ